MLPFGSVMDAAINAAGKFVQQFVDGYESAISGARACGRR